MAKFHPDFTAAGARVVGICVDSPQRNAAMVGKLNLPFPVLSDPDGEEAIKPYGVWHDGAGMARPAVILLDPDGRETFRQVGEDFADRLPEEDLLERVRALGLSSTTQDEPAPGDPQPSDHAVGIGFLKPYFTGGRFTSIALGGRVAEAKQKAEVMQRMYDRFLEALSERAS